MQPWGEGMESTAVAGNVVTAATALAGLIFIYIGTLVTAFSSYQAQEQKSVRGRFLARAWLAFVGMALALLSAGLAIAGQWLANTCLATLSVWILLAAFAWAVLAAVLTIREIG